MRGGGTQTGPLLSIQYLRAIAALMVLGYHACRWAWRSFDIGAAGVDVFFVISGFILWTIAAERPITPGAFLWRRLTRIAPLYWILTLGVAGAAMLWPGFFFDAVPSRSHVLLSLGFVPHLNQDGQPFPLISAGWSLNYEVVFYLLFAATLFAKTHRFAWLAASLVGIAAFGWIVKPAYYLGFNLMFLQFLAGAGFAKLRLERRLPNGGFGWVWFTAGAAGFLGLSFNAHFDGLLRPILWGIPAFCLVAGLVMVEDGGRLPRIPGLKFLGDASYSIYLVHIVVTECLTHLINSGRPVYILVAVSLSLALGIICHLFVEKPLLSLFRKAPRAALPSGAI